MMTDHSLKPETGKISLTGNAAIISFYDAEGKLVQ